MQDGQLGCQQLPRAGSGLQLACGQLTALLLPPAALPLIRLRAPAQLFSLWVSSAGAGEQGATILSLHLGLLSSEPLRPELSRQTSYKGLPGADHQGRVTAGPL